MADLEVAQLVPQVALGGQHPKFSPVHSRAGVICITSLVCVPYGLFSTNQQVVWTLVEVDVYLRTLLLQRVTTNHQKV